MKKVILLLQTLCIHVSLTYGQFNLNVYELPIMERQSLAKIIESPFGDNFVYFSSRHCNQSIVGLFNNGMFHKRNVNIEGHIESAVYDWIGHLWVLAVDNNSTISIYEFNDRLDVIRVIPTSLERDKYDPDIELFWSNGLEFSIKGGWCRWTEDNGLLVTTLNDESYDYPIAIAYNDHYDARVIASDRSIIILDNNLNIINEIEFPAVLDVLSYKDKIFVLGRFNILEVKINGETDLVRNFGFLDSGSAKLFMFNDDTYVLSSSSSLFWSEILGPSTEASFDTLSIVDEVGYLWHPSETFSLEGPYLLGYAESSYHLVQISNNAPDFNNSLDLVLNDASINIVDTFYDRKSRTDRIRFSLDIEVSNTSNDTAFFFTVFINSDHSSCAPIDNFVLIRDEMILPHSSEMYYNTLYIDVSLDEVSDYDWPEVWVLSINGIPDSDITNNSKWLSMNLINSEASDQVLKRNVEVFPNPFLDRVIIQMDEGIEFYQIDLLNTSGNVVESVSKYTNELLLNNLLPGNYYLIIYSNQSDAPMVTKLIKQR